MGLAIIIMELLQQWIARATIISQITSEEKALVSFPS